MRRQTPNFLLKPTIAKNFLDIATLIINMRAPIGEAPVGFLLSLCGYEICGCVMGRRRFSIKVAMSRKFFAMVGWRRKFGVCLRKRPA